MSDKVYVVGLGPDGISGLSASAVKLVSQAQVLLGGKRLLDMVQRFDGRRIVIDRNLDDHVDFIKNSLGRQQIVVLASGDPNFYGIARTLVSKLGRDSVEILPGISSIQLAFARIKESWDDAVFASAHGRPISDMVDLVRCNRKVCLLTDPSNSPGKIAETLLQRGIENCAAHVCEDLGSDQERVTATDLHSLVGKIFSPLNVMILIKDEKCVTIEPRQVLGIPDDEFDRREPGLITKLEVRAVSLAKLCLTENSEVWDIGAGSGAVSVEAASVARKGHVTAVERNASSVANIRENVRRFGRANVDVFQAAAPDGLEGLPDPDAVFIGGSGGRLGQILATACRRLKPSGRIVVNAATLETLHTAIEALKQHGFGVETTLINVARSEDVAGLSRLEALNPVFVVAAWRGEGGNRGEL